MAYVANNNNVDTNLTTTTPFMDRLSHSVIKETSKNLRYYINVKRRENAFILNPNSSAVDSIPLKARFIYGTTKEYPPLYGSCHSDNDVKVYARSFQQQQKEPYLLSSSPEKQMCREELNFHMRSYSHSPRENLKFSDLRLTPLTRSNSSCSRTTARKVRKQIPKSAFKLSRHEQNQLIDDTANILASMIRTRRLIYETNLISQQIPPIYESRNTNPSPRQIDDQTNIQSLPKPLTQPSTDLKLLSTIEKPKKQKRTTDNLLEKAASIMHTAKPMTKGFLCEYKISVITGNCNGASTNAPICIKLYGTNGYTSFHDLVDSETHRVSFLKGQTDIFKIQTYHVGQLAGITIGHDRKDMRSSWFLNKVLIDDPVRNITYEIPCNAWLSIKSNDQKTMRDFQIVSMISHKKSTDSDGHQEEVRSQSDYSTTSEHTATSNTTNSSQNHQFKQTKKQQHVSISSATAIKKPTSLAAITNHLSQPPPPTTVESHFNQNEFLPPPIPTRRSVSPIISPTSSSDTEIEENVVHHSGSTTPTPSPTIDHSRIQFASNHTTSQTTDTPTNDLYRRYSIDNNRPPARLEKRNSPISLSPERPIKNKEETNENEAFSFFD